MNAKKNAPIATKVIIETNIGVNTIESAAKEEIIVPKVPTNKQVVFLDRHLVKALDGLSELKTMVAIKNIKAKTPIPKAIQVAVTIPGIKLYANRIPIAAPNKIQIRTPVQLQAVKLQFLHFILSPPFIH